MPFDPSIDPEDRPAFMRAIGYTLLCVGLLLGISLFSGTAVLLAIAGGLVFAGVKLIWKGRSKDV